MLGLSIRRPIRLICKLYLFTILPNCHRHYITDTELKSVCPKDQKPCVKQSSCGFTKKLVPYHDATISFIDCSGDIRRLRWVMSSANISRLPYTLTVLSPEVPIISRLPPKGSCQIHFRGSRQIFFEYCSFSLLRPGHPTVVANIFWP